MDQTQDTHFFFMAALGPGDGGPIHVELEGTFTPLPSSTWHQVYQELREKVRSRLDCSSKAVTVTAFTIKPNAIGA